MIYLPNGDIDFDALATELRSPKVSRKRKNAICEWLAEIASQALTELERDGYGPEQTNAPRGQPGPG